MAEMTSMRNIGREMARKLQVLGINSAEELRDMGAKAAFLQLKATWPQVCLVHLYALEGAVQDIEFNGLAEERKRELKAFNDALKK